MTNTSTTPNDAHDAPPQVRFEPGRGWICSCTGVYVERVDFSLDCHHWPLCEHLVAAARKAETKLLGPGG